MGEGEREGGREHSDVLGVSSEKDLRERFQNTQQLSYRDALKLNTRTS